MPRRPLVIVAALALAFSGCGDDPATGGAGGKTLGISDADRTQYDLVVEAHDIKFDAKDYSVTEGPIDIAYIEEGDLVHNLIVQRPDEVAIPITGGDRDGKLVVTTKSDATGSVTLETGSYTLICTVPGHAAAGMKATLTVG